MKVLGAYRFATYDNWIQASKAYLTETTSDPDQGSNRSFTLPGEVVQIGIHVINSARESHVIASSVPNPYR